MSRSCDREGTYRNISNASLRNNDRLGSWWTWGRDKTAARTADSCWGHGGRNVARVRKGWGRISLDLGGSVATSPSGVLRAVAIIKGVDVAGCVKSVAGCGLVI